MKTIFISLLQGVEAKNILRTGVIDTLLRDPDMRVVLFLKSAKRADFYKKEFSHPRMIYEVIDIAHSRGLDALFAKLKFTLLRTETTDLRRRLRYEETGNVLQFSAGHMINWLFARSFVRRVVRYFDRHLVVFDAYAPYFERYKPDLVFLAHLFDEKEVHILREAKKRGVKTVGFVNSWDKVTARCILRLLPDKMVVFNDLVKEELKQYDEMKDGDIYVAGIPQYDRYVSVEPSSRSDFFRNIGADPQKKLIVFAPAGKSDSESDWNMIDIIHVFLQKGDIAVPASFLVRFQPNDEIDEQELKKRPWLLYDRPGKRFSKRGGVDWDMSNDDISHLHDTLFHMDLLICYGSSLSIDAAFLDKPVIHVGFEANPKSAPSKRTSRFYGMAHAKKAFSSGAVPRAHSADELKELINRHLSDPAIGREKRIMFVKEQCTYRDGKSVERIASFLRNLIK